MYIQKILFIEWEDIPEDEKADYEIGQIAYAGDSIGRELISLTNYDPIDLYDIDYIKIVPWKN